MIDEVGEVVVMLVLHVHPEVTGTGEYGLAFLADEALSDVSHGGGRRCFLAVHSLLMSTEMIVASKVFRTVSAVVWLKLGMDERVSRQMITSVEAVVALRTFVSLRAVDFFLRLFIRAGCG